MELGEAPRDSTGFAAMEEGLISRSGRPLSEVLVRSDEAGPDHSGLLEKELLL